MTVRQSVSLLTARFHPAVWWGVALVMIVVFQLTQRWLDGLYTASQFPVPYYVAQTAFDGDKLKAWYAVLIERGTLERYVQVQIADYLYMLTVLAAFFTLAVAVFRTLPTGSRLKPVAYAMIFVGPMAPLFDALENLVSFVMLADPLAFADWLAYPYSAFACAKFAVYVLVYLWTPLALIGAVVSWLVRGLRRVPGKSFHIS